MIVPTRERLPDICTTYFVEIGFERLRMRHKCSASYTSPAFFPSHSPLPSSHNFLLQFQLLGPVIFQLLGWLSIVLATASHADRIFIAPLVLELTSSQISL